MNYTFNKKLVEQLRNGEICAYFNREKDSLEMLQALLSTAFPDDNATLSGDCLYYQELNTDSWIGKVKTDKTPIPLSNFVQPEQSERDVMAGFDERLRRLEDILLKDNEPCKAEPEPADAEIVKPPLGIAPEWLWREQRVMSIKSAMERYTQSNTAIPKEWAEELAKHFEFLENREQQPKPKWTPKVGEWFKDMLESLYYCTVSDQNGVEGDNQNGGKISCTLECELTKPTDKEVEDYMVGLAKEKFPAGTQIKTGTTNNFTMPNTSFKYELGDLCVELPDGIGWFILWSKGQWAEPVNPVRWRAKLLGFYYYINDVFEVKPTTEIYTDIHNKHYDCGNYFQTAQQAEEMAVLLQFTLNNPELVKQLMDKKE